MKSPQGWFRKWQCTYLLAKTNSNLPKQYDISASVFFPMLYRKSNQSESFSSGYKQRNVSLTSRTGLKNISNRFAALTATSGGLNRTKAEPQARVQVYFDYIWPSWAVDLPYSEQSRQQPDQCVSPPAGMQHSHGSKTTPLSLNETACETLAKATRRDPFTFTCAWASRGLCWSITDGAHCIHTAYCAVIQWGERDEREENVRSHAE